MQTIYKVFLVLFIVFLGINLYAMDYEIGVMHPENTKFVFSIVMSLLGIILVFVLDTWRRLMAKK